MYVLVLMGRVNIRCVAGGTPYGVASGGQEKPLPDRPRPSTVASFHRACRRDCHIPVQILAGKFKVEFLPTDSCINLVPAARDHFLSHRSVHTRIKLFSAA